MADDWQVGDLALCIASGTKSRKGRIYLVAGSHPGGLCSCGRWVPSAAIDLPELGPPESGCTHVWGETTRFIKITPEAEDAFDREVIAHMAGQEVVSADHIPGVGKMVGP